jgi:hypothetical protein
MGLEIIHLELDTALEAIELHLRWTNTKPAYLNKSNLKFILGATKTRFNSDEKPLQKKGVLYADSNCKEPSFGRR